MTFPIPCSPSESQCTGKEMAMAPFDRQLVRTNDNNRELYVEGLLCVIAIP